MSDMTASRPAAALAQYTGDPSQVLYDAITAKINGDLTDEQFELVIAAAQAIPGQRAQYVEARLLPDETASALVNYSRVQLVYAWLATRPLVGTFLIVLAIALAGITGWALTAAVQAFWAWLGLHIICVGVTVFIAMVMVLIFKSLTVQGRRASADLYQAKAARYQHQVPVHINVEQ
jgi:hypothetical protein